MKGFAGISQLEFDRKIEYSGQGDKQKKVNKYVLTEL